MPARIASVDILRALTMTLMIFVNDLWSLNNIPDWLEHTKAEEDGMGLADVVFPAFLVIVGMSIPFATASRMKKGESRFTIFLHVLQRSLALIVMGVFLVNGESLHGEGTGMSRHAWNSIACLCFIFIWNAYPKDFSKKLQIVLKTVAWATLIVMAFLYRGGDGSVRFSTSWWGILGLIGWSYLLGATIYTFFANKPLTVLIFFVLLVTYSCLATAGLGLKDSFLATLLSPFGKGSLSALVLTGTLSSMVFLYCRQKNRPYQLILYLAVISAVLIAVGFFLRQYWGISKIRATPAWVLICGGLTLASFAFVYWFADLKSQARWFKIISPAGYNTLLCYLLPYFAYAFVTWLNISLPAAMYSGFIGLLKSLLFAVIIINVAGFLAKKGVVLKL